MASIEKMLISGIRSYSPSDGSVIEFQTPLTLIVGPNGSGKTTIIESLKFISTGDMPPGCKQAAFIHDPKIAREKEVKGQVKLRFVDVVGTKCEATRSMSSIQKQKKIETKSLEGVLAKFVDGQRVSISSRCTDFSKEMISRLGVSKAILENVVFCHQEDANWPLSEGKVLKMKFDEIFAATRYIKALESIRTLRKEQAQSVKEFNIELGHLKQTKEKSLEIAAEMNRAQAQTLVCKEEIKKLVVNIVPIETRLSELDTVSEDVFQLEKRKGTYNSTMEQLQKNVSDLQSKVTKPFKGSLVELTRTKEEFRGTMAAKEEKLQELENRVKKCTGDVQRYAIEKTELLREHGKLEQEAEVHKSRVVEKDQLVMAISSEYQIPGYSRGPFTNSQTANFLASLKETYARQVEDGKQSKERFQENLDEVSLKIKSLEKGIHLQEGAIGHKQKSMDENMKKLQLLAQQLTAMDASENRLPALEFELRRAEQEVSDMKSSCDFTQHTEEISLLTKEKRDLERKLDKLREEEGLMVQQAKAQTKVDMLLKDKANKEDSIQNILRRHEDALDTIFEARPANEDLKSNLSRYLRDKQLQLKTKTDDFQRLRQSLAQKESSKKMFQDELRVKEQKASQFQEQLHEVCGENDFNEFREKILSNEEQYSSTIVEIGAFEKIYQKYLNQLHSSDVADKGCPLCHRKFSKDTELRSLIDELRHKLNAVPIKRLETEEALEREKRLSLRVRDLAPVKSKLDDLSSHDLPDLRKKIATVTEELAAVKLQIEECDNIRALLEHEESSGRSIEADISKLNDYYYELKDLDRQLTLESSKLQGIRPGSSMQALRGEIQEVQEQVNMMGRRIDQKKDLLMENQRQMSILEGNVNQLKSQKLAMQSQLQSRSNLEKQKADLTSENLAWEREIKEAKAQVSASKASLVSVNEKKQELDIANEKLKEDVRNKLERIKSLGNKLRDLDEKISKFTAEGKESDIANNQERLERLERRLGEIEKERDGFSSSVHLIKEEIAQQEVKSRELEDNIKLMNTEKEIADIRRELMQVSQQLSLLGDYNEISRKRADLQAELDKLRRDRVTFEGQLNMHESEVKRCQRELRSALYADAEAKHRKKMIEVKTTEMANLDLDKYYKALDRAIMRYHGLKLAEINKIIKEYWVKTYRGNDIDTIEIQADEEEGSGAAKNRRSFAYRVVMVKNGVSLDMRSRCSAGQKVLASIIIRLALAETFCLNCGILALDEPTTNLDEGNIESLANALKDIIEVRHLQKNFQLIIITHDEEFVQALGRSDYVDYYFRVYKDERGNSKIHRLKIGNDLVEDSQAD